MQSMMALVRVLSSIGAASFVLWGCEAPRPGLPDGWDASGPIRVSMDAAAMDTGGCIPICGGACCSARQLCYRDFCIPDLGDCQSHDDCQGDSYCAEEGVCVPYGVPSDVVHDPGCERPVELGEFLPAVQCEWLGPPEGEPFADYKEVYSTPLVVDFDLDDSDDVVSPSIVIASYGVGRDANGSVLRILDGRTCEEQHSLLEPSDRLVYASNQAIADLDGEPDGRPEIVGMALIPSDDAPAGIPYGIVAFRYDPEERQFVRAFRGRRCDIEGEPVHAVGWHLYNNGPSIHDLDNDARPEIIFEGYVYDHQGCLLNPGWSRAPYLELGVFSVVADVDGDSHPELVEPNGVYRWNDVEQTWEREAYWPSLSEEDSIDHRDGHVGIADFGDFPAARNDAPGRAEIVVVSATDPARLSLSPGNVRVVSTGGTLVFGPVDLPADDGEPAGRGGPPTIADFDGDGRPEIGVAGASRYTVFDLDCDIDDVSGPGCNRETEAPRGVFWSQRVRDYSSNATGSAVFDFDGDGQAEVVYRDECFLRIFRGADGAVLFSHAASSGTGYDYPVIADVDGDFNSEIVIARTNYSRGCPGRDPLSEVESLFSPASGILVVRDILDRWVSSRPLWNQHTYSVTNIQDDGTVPASGAWVPNHVVAELNTFRANTQGDLEVLGAGDLTVALVEPETLCAPTGSELTVHARVCNRGTNPVPDGAVVAFYEEAETRRRACVSQVGQLLGVGECAEVSCTWTVDDSEAGRHVLVEVDPDEELFECRRTNNRGVSAELYCVF